MSQFNVALFGAGRIGHVHARNIADHPSTALVHVVDSVEGRAQELAARWGAAPADEATVFDDDTIDAIVVASLTSTHAELIERGVAAGKAVFCEKPIDLDIPSRSRRAVDGRSRRPSGDAGVQPPLRSGSRRGPAAGASGAVGTVEIPGASPEAP